MTATVLDGSALARRIQAEIAAEVAQFVAAHAVTPCLAAMLVGDNPASEIYVRHKRQACARCGIESRLVRLSDSADPEQVLSGVSTLNQDPLVHGILVQLPLPGGIDSGKVLEAVHPMKDVDAFHPENVGRIVQGRPRFLPCTPQGIVALLASAGTGTSGKHVVIVGRSEIVGKPLANMLMQRGADATVTLCHSRTPDLAAFTCQADILIVAAGRPRLITADMIKPQAVVIDVGMNRLAEGLVGDVDYESVREVASAITPVPGGVGPLTVTMLLKNTLAAARLQVSDGN